MSKEFVQKNSWNKNKIWNFRYWHTSVTLEFPLRHAYFAISGLNELKGKSYNNNNDYTRNSNSTINLTDTMTNKQTNIYSRWYIDGRNTIKVNNQTVVRNRYRKINRIYLNNCKEN